MATPIRWAALWLVARGAPAMNATYRSALAAAIAAEARLNATRAMNATRLAAPDFADVSYGPYRRQKLDVWLTEAPGPRPMVVFVHGGGWVGGDKAPAAGDDDAWHRAFQVPPAPGTRIEARGRPSRAFPGPHDARPRRALGGG